MIGSLISFDRDLFELYAGRPRVLAQKARERLSFREAASVDRETVSLEIHLERRTPSIVRSQACRLKMCSDHIDLYGVLIRDHDPLERLVSDDAIAVEAGLFANKTNRNPCATNLGGGGSPALSERLGQFLERLWLIWAWSVLSNGIPGYLVRS
jgi:hypothetical protein